MTNIAEIPIDIMPIGSLMMENGIVCITCKLSMAYQNSFGRIYNFILIFKGLAVMNPAITY